MDWRFSGFVIGMIAFLAFWTISPDSALCQSEVVKSAVDAAGKDSPINCLDYWVYRYQTLIGAFTTVGAAIYAGQWVRRQIDKTNEQMEFARAQISSDFVQTLDIRSDKIKNLIVHVEKMSAQFRVVQYGLGELIREGLEHFSTEVEINTDPARIHNHQQIEMRIAYMQHMLVDAFVAIEGSQKSAKLDGIPISLIKEYRSATSRAVSILRHYISTHEQISYTFLHRSSGQAFDKNDALFIFKFASKRTEDNIEEHPYNKMMFDCADEQIKIMKLRDSCTARVDALIADVDPAMDQ